MELLISPRKKYLLEAGIEILHQESRSWLNTISFWEDEGRMYKHFLNNTLFQNVPEKEKKQISDLYEQLIGKKLSSFKSALLMHEKELNALLKSKKSNSDYREKHKDMHTRFEDLDQQMKLFKKSIYELLKLVNLNFFNGNETLFTINERRAVRKYKTDPVKRIHLEQLISAARMAPTASNKQEWRFYILTNPKKIKKYSSEIQKVADNILHLSLKKFHKEEDPVFHGAPAVIFITAPKINEWASLDVGMCAQNIMLAARSMGYDSCPIGLAKALEKTPVYKELGIPVSEEIKIAVVIGLSDEKPVVHPRKTDNLTFLS